jgi:hypothetical protein
MPDIVFVRANHAMPVKEGAAVAIVGPALGSGAIFSVMRQDSLVPSGQSGFAQTVLSGRFRHYSYYVGASGDQPDNTINPIF